MADPIFETSTADEFAQTRGADDLFDDEIIPVPGGKQIQPVSELQIEIQENQGSDAYVSRADSPLQSRGIERGRGRGRGKGRGRRGLQNFGPKRAEGSSKNSRIENAADDGKDKDAEADKAAEGTEQPDADNNTALASSNGAESARVPAVRGDRSATGGVRKPKLTEEELSQRMAAAKQNAAKVAAAHARAEADQASFLEREKVAAEKKREEFRNRRVMDSEREQNRQRKLGALQGREWDVEKREEDHSHRGRGSQFRRGMHGGISGYVRRDFDDRRLNDETFSGNNHSHYRGRGRGGRGGRGGRARRGSPEPHGDSPTSSGIPNVSPQPTPIVNTEDEFPSLPGNTNKKETNVKPAATSATEPADSPFASATGEWAEEVEADRE